MLSKVVGLVFAFLTLPALSGQSAASFKVIVTLQASQPASAFCRVGPGPNTFGAVVTVVCATGAVVNIEAPANATPWGPIHGGAYRYHHLSENVLFGMNFPGGIDLYTGVGTVTSWRIVNLPDRDYLEMQMDW
jgi:hypothetical protein